MVVVLIILSVLFLVGMPVAFALGIAPLWALVERGIPLLVVPQTAFEMLDSFALLAVIYFILAGRLMQSAGVARRLVELAVALTSWMRGGLGGAAVLTTMMFSTMSGSSSATTAAVGGVLTPEMEKSGYPRPFIAALLASSGELGVIIPPSVPMILYAVTTGVSITHLFLAGIIPGLMIGCSLIVTVSIICAVRQYGTVSRTSVVVWLRGAASAFASAFLSLLMPVIVLGGIYGGVFTATEAAVVAVAYTLFLGLVVYREMHIRDLPRIFSESALTASVVMVIVAFAAVLAFTLSIFQVPQTVARTMLSVTQDPLLFLIMVNLLLLVVGMFLETFAALLILAPVLAPAASALGIDPIHFAVIMICNLAIGMVTPPLGVNLFIMSGVAKVSIEQMMRPLSIFVAVLVLNLMLITYFPWLSLAFVR